MEQVVIIAIIIGISALHAWWKKRQGEGEDASDTGPMPPPAGRPNDPSPGRSQRPASPAANWEGELRRLLQGEDPSRPSRPPPPLPTVVASRPAPVRRPPQVTHSDPDMDIGISMPMGMFAHSGYGGSSASDRESRVAEPMQHVPQQLTLRSKMELRKEVAPEIRQGIGLIHDRQSQRAAIIAGILLGPPKALEN
jgi:hypothetical protein